MIKLIVKQKQTNCCVCSKMHTYMRLHKNIFVFLCFVIVVNVCNLIFLFSCSIVAYASLHLSVRKKIPTEWPSWEKTLKILRITYLFSCVFSIEGGIISVYFTLSLFPFSIVCVFFAFLMFRVRCTWCNKEDKNSFFSSLSFDCTMWHYII